MSPRIVSSSIGTKVFIALTGICLFVFLVGHLAGNLLVFVGPHAFNGYAHKLISNPLVYLVEAVLVAIFLIHVWKTVRNYLDNRDARPVGYAVTGKAGGPSRKNAASMTMIVTGLVTAAFVVWHLKTFKFGPSYPIEEGGATIRDLYTLEVEVFRNPMYVALYVACMALIGFHLWHGVGSAAESLGIDHPRRTPAILTFGKVMAIVIAGGFLVIPIFFFFFVGGRS